MNGQHVFALVAVLVVIGYALDRDRGGLNPSSRADDDDAHVPGLVELAAYWNARRRALFG